MANFSAVNYLQDKIPASCNYDVTVDSKYDYDRVTYTAPNVTTPTRSTPTDIRTTTSCGGVSDVQPFVSESPITTSSSLDESGYHSPTCVRSPSFESSSPVYAYSALGSVCDDVTVEMRSLESRLVTLSRRFPYVSQMHDFYRQMSAVLCDTTDLRRMIKRVSQSLDLVEFVELQKSSEMETVRHQSRTALDISAAQSNCTRKRKRHDEMTSSPVAKSRRITSVETEILTDWYTRHADSPYATPAEVAELSRQSQLTHAQVTKWLSNKRNRTGKCRPKRKYFYYGSVNGLASLCLDEQRRQ